MASAELPTEYEARIAALERLVGRQALELEFLTGAPGKHSIAETRACIRDHRFRGIWADRCPAACSIRIADRNMLRTSTACF